MATLVIMSQRLKNTKQRHRATQ